MFYMLGGALEVMMAVVIFLLTESIWVRVASAVLASEGAQIVICRIAVQDVHAARGQNLCDYATGLPVTSFMWAMYLLLICWPIVKWVRKK